MGFKLAALKTIPLPSTETVCVNSPVTEGFDKVGETIDALSATD